MTDSLSAAESLMRTQSVALAVRTELGAVGNGAVGAEAGRQEAEYSTGGEKVKAVSLSYDAEMLK